MQEEKCVRIDRDEYVIFEFRNETALHRWLGRRRRVGRSNALQVFRLEMQAQTWQSENHFTIVIAAVRLLAA